MFNLKGKKKHNLEETKKKIEEEIESLSKTYDIYHPRYKEVDGEFYINITIDRRLSAIDSTNPKAKLPDLIAFVILVDLFYPEREPKVLLKSNICQPTLMDGRDLLIEICPKWEPKHSKLEDILKSIPQFLNKVANSIGYKFYGKFHIGAIYDLKNFDNMLVNSFTCKLEDNKDVCTPSSLSLGTEYTMVLSEDALILFAKKDNNGLGSIVFWASLYSIAVLQINKMQKIVTLNFYNNETTAEYHLKLSIENILFFRDTLTKKMRSLSVRVETTKLAKGQKLDKRLTNRDIDQMNSDDMEKNVKDLERRIEGGEINDYTVQTFNRLCGKTIEYFSNIDSEKQWEYLEIMKKIIKMDAVQKRIEENQKDIDGERNDDDD